MLHKCLSSQSSKDSPGLELDLVSTARFCVAKGRGEVMLILGASPFVFAIPREEKGLSGVEELVFATLIQDLVCSDDCGLSRSSGLERAACEPVVSLPKVSPPGDGCCVVELPNLANLLFRI